MTVARVLHPTRGIVALYTDRVFAGLATVVLIGLSVESLGFKTLERLTVRKWGQQR